MDKYNPQLLGETIKKIRRSKGLNQEDVSGKLGLSRVSIANMEAAKQAISIEILYKLAEIFEVSIINLILNNPCPKPEQEKTENISFQKTRDQAIDVAYMIIKQKESLGQKLLIQKSDLEVVTLYKDHVQVSTSISNGESYEDYRCKFSFDQAVNLIKQ